ncbi:MAG: DUF4124 domain-containing protein [Steroidobacteraceae bacterium]
MFTLMSIACTLAVAATATVYKWVDENGVVHYSDQPHENAQKVELKAPQTYSAPKMATPPPSTGPGKPPSRPAPVYRSCAISEPVNDQMFMNTSTVTAGVSLEPAARPGDQLVVTLDGQRVPGVPADGGQFTISPVDRGTHSLQAVVQDAQGQAICQSPSVTFHVHQPSILAPNPAVRPRR